MTSNQKFSLNDPIEPQFTNDEIDLKKVFGVLIRYKKLIAKFTISGFLLGGLIAFNTKNVWQGEFQIVLEVGNSQSSVLSAVPGFANLTGLAQGDKQLGTEVGILKSPSVLMNIFEFVKTQKALKNNPIEQMRFKDWQKSSLNVVLESGTSILNLSFRDTDKDLILPVLNKISSTYQEYSDRKRLRDIDLGLDYFKKQIELFKSKSIESLAKSQKFAIDQDLSVIQDIKDVSLSMPNTYFSPINIDVIRGTERAKIRVIDQQLKQIQDTNFQADLIIYLASTMPSMLEINEYINIKIIDSKLAKLSLIYTENDKSIQELRKERKYMVELLKERVEGSLIAEKADSQARLNAAERPEGVILEYRMLLSDAVKDKASLDKLENQYRALLLEKARSEAPWELITTPTLLPFPVAPKKSRFFALGLLAGLVSGSGAALISNKRRDIIFSADEMSSFGKWPLLIDLSAIQKQFWTENLDLLAIGKLSESDGPISLIVVGDIDVDDSEITNLSQSLKRSLKNREVTVAKNLLEAMQSSNLLVITILGVTKKKELIDTRNNLVLQNKSVLGLITLKNINLIT